MVILIMAMLINALQIQAHHIVSSSDNIRPRWCDRTDDILRYNSTYEYKCSVETGQDLLNLKNNRLRNLGQYMEGVYKIDGVINSEYLQENKNGTIDDEEIYKIKFQTQSSILEFECKFIDEYWERYDDGEYRLFSLYAVSIPNTKPQFDTYTLSTHYKPSEGLARSFVPGWGQIYKGSKTKGGLIIAGEALGVGGIVTCYSMKASYEKLMQEDPKHIKDYSMSADMWQNIGYGCIAFTAAVYIYNLIDAAVAPGARRVIVLPRQQTMAIVPYVTYDGSAGLAIKLNF